MVRLIALLALAVLAGCANSRPLPVVSGPVRQLNVGHWVPNTNELTVPPS